MPTQSTREHIIDAASEVRAELARQRMSGRQLASALGVTQMYVARRLSGAVDLSATDLARISTVLSVPVGKFFGEVEK